MVVLTQEEMASVQFIREEISEHYHPSLARALDEGGMVWEGSAHYETVDEAFDALESALAEWMEQNA